MTYSSQNEFLSSNDNYITEDGDVRPIDDNPEGFDAVGHMTPRDYDIEEVQTVDDRYFHEELQSVEYGEGVSVDLGIRAVSLLEALDYYSRASMLRGLINSRNDSLIEKYGGKQNIAKRIKHDVARGRAALSRGTGIDEMLAQPEMFADEDGVSFSEEQAHDMLIGYQCQLRETMTADSHSNSSEISHQDKINAQRRAKVKREEFRDQLKI